MLGDTRQHGKGRGEGSELRKAFPMQWNHTALEICFGGEARENIYKAQNNPVIKLNNLHSAAKLVCSSLACEFRLEGIQPEREPESAPRRMLLWQTHTANILQHLLSQPAPNCHGGLKYNCRLMLNSLDAVVCRAVHVTDVAGIALRAWCLLLLSHAKNLIRHSWHSAGFNAPQWKISTYQKWSRKPAKTFYNHQYAKIFTLVEVIDRSAPFPQGCSIPLHK